jgi:cobalt/nickel transport system ATP-binding protein
MSPAVEVRDLSFQYSDRTEALRGVCLSIADGECVGLIGPNGAGKSTLLLHLNGLLPESWTDKTSVFVEGTPVTPESLPQIRRKVGLLFQDPNDQLFCSTVYEDVAFGPQQFGLHDAEISTRVITSLGQVGLSGFENRAPHHLSAGEKRRVCLAGVLACEPSILVLDEPTASLDPRGRRELKQLLRQIPITKLIATHDLEFVVELCSRAIVLDKGCVVAEGPTAELLGNEELMLRHDLERPHVLRHLHPH